MSVTNCNKWNTLKKTMMLELVRAKYMQNEDLMQILLDTEIGTSERPGEIPSFSLDYHLTIPIIQL